MSGRKTLGRALGLVSLFVALVAAPLGDVAQSEASKHDTKVQAPMIAGLAKRGSMRTWAKYQPDTALSALKADVYSTEFAPGAAPVEVSAPINAIWTRLLQASPVASAPIIFVDDCSDRTAEALAAGAVRLCRGYLRVLQNQDQIAGIVAHEMAHLMLGHTDAARRRGSGFAVLNGLNDAAIVAVLASGGGRLPFFSTLIGANDAKAIPSGWMDRANQREELEADKLGIDLLVSAGFSAQGFLDVMDIEGFECGATAARVAPKFQIYVDTSKRFTHPDKGQRRCAAYDYILQFYPDALQRPQAPLPWASRNPKSPAGRYFIDMDRAEDMISEAHKDRLALLMNRSDKTANLQCKGLKAEATRLTTKYPNDRDLRRLRSAVALGCLDTDQAFDALVMEIAPAARSRRASFQTLAIGLLDPNKPAAANLYSLWLKEDFEAGIQAPPTTWGNLLGVQNAGVDAMREYETAACVLDSPELMAAKDNACMRYFGGTAAAWTCDHKTDIKGTCASSPNFPKARPMGPYNFLATQSRWYAAALAR